MDLVYYDCMEVNIHEAKTHFSRLLQRVAAGEEVVIARAGVPVARLVAVEPKKAKTRPLGMDEGRIWIADDFDAPLPDDLAERVLRGHPAQVDRKTSQEAQMKYLLDTMVWLWSVGPSRTIGTAGLEILASPETRRSIFPRPVRGKSQSRPGWENFNCPSHPAVMCPSDWSNKGFDHFR